MNIITFFQSFWFKFIASLLILLISTYLIFTTVKTLESKFTELGRNQIELRDEQQRNTVLLNSIKEDNDRIRLQQEEIVRNTDTINRNNNSIVDIRNRLNSIATNPEINPTQYSDELNQLIQAEYQCTTRILQGATDVSTCS